MLCSERILVFFVCFSEATLIYIHIGITCSRECCDTTEVGNS